jgi:hypothetical protein
VSEQLFDKLIGIFFRFFFLLFLMFVSIELSFLSLVYGFLNSYLVWAFVVVALTVYLLKCYFDIREFREALSQGLLLPHKENEAEKLEPLNMDLENEDLALKVCLLYRNGASFPKIKRKLGFSHPTAVQRLLRKGLDVLLKTYKEVKNQND